MKRYIRSSSESPKNGYSKDSLDRLADAIYRDEYLAEEFDNDLSLIKTHLWFAPEAEVIDYARKALQEDWNY